MTYLVLSGSSDLRSHLEVLMIMAILAFFNRTALYIMSRGMIKSVFVLSIAKEIRRHH